LLPSFFEVLSLLSLALGFQTASRLILYVSRAFDKHKTSLSPKQLHILRIQNTYTCFDCCL